MDRRTRRQKLAAMAAQTRQSPNEAAIAAAKLAELQEPVAAPEQAPHWMSMNEAPDSDDEPMQQGWYRTGPDTWTQFVGGRVVQVVQVTTYQSTSSNAANSFTFTFGSE